MDNERFESNVKVMQKALEALSELTLDDYPVENDLSDATDNLIQIKEALKKYFVTVPEGTRRGAYSIAWISKALVDALPCEILRQGGTLETSTMGERNTRFDKPIRRNKANEKTRS